MTQEFKKYTASEIKNNLTKIFIDAENEPVVITRRGSKPYILLGLEQYYQNCAHSQSETKEQVHVTTYESESVDNDTLQQKNNVSLGDLESSIETNVLRADRMVANKDFDDYWNTYMIPSEQKKENDQGVSNSMHTKNKPGWLQKFYYYTCVKYY